MQDTYKATIAIGPNGEPLGDEVGCVAVPPAEQCVIKVNETKYPPGTEFKVKVHSVKDGVRSDPVETTTQTDSTDSEFFSVFLNTKTKVPFLPSPAIRDEHHPH